MTEGFVEVYSTATNEKHMVPPHFLDNPVLSQGIKPTAAGRETLGLVQAEPSLDWTREQLDKHAEALGIDTTGLANKAEALAAISGGPQSDPATGSIGPGDPTSTNDPAAVADEE